MEFIKFALNEFKESIYFSFFMGVFSFLIIFFIAFAAIYRG